MASEREYTVIVNAREDLPQIETELTASSGAGPIPNRTVDVANPRPGSKVQTHFMLTDEEAQALRSDPRIRAVEIPPDQRDDISIGLNKSQTGNFERSSQLFNDRVNWGLRRCIETTNIYGRSSTSPQTPFTYGIDGTGVDVVIQDSGIQPGHPEWLDYNGNTRLKEIDWYTESGLSGTQHPSHYLDRDGHGTHCAGITAGLIYGWAKGAHIYSQKLAGLETLSGPDGTGISITDAFDTIRLWHNNKTNGRPTVVNMSWGYGATITGDPTSGVYRGTSWTYGVDYTTRDELEAATGVSPARFISGLTFFFRIPVRVASVDAEIEDMITDGIHICIAAGNKYHKIDVPTGLDYNNTVTFGGSTYSYHQGSSPYSENAFIVASVDSTHTGQPAASNLDKTSSFSERGPGTTIFAPGSDIMSASSNEADARYDTIEHPTDPNYVIMNIGGTSMASPQVAGVCAQHLQLYPNLTPAELQARIIADSKPVMYSTGSDTDYDEILTSIWGAENRMLYSRYGKQPLTLRNINIV